MQIANARRAACLGILLAVAVALPAVAQVAPAEPPPPPWAGTLSAGLALTGGNTDTRTFNLAFDIQSDKTKRNVLKTEGLHIRASQEDSEIVDRTSLSGRDEYRLTGRSYVFGQLQYLRDAFKSIDYLLSPAGGLGYKLLDSPATTLAMDVGIGGVVEKNPDLDRRTSGAVTLGEKGTRKLGTATVAQSFNALWIASDFADALYTFQVGLAADVISHFQLKVDFLDTYKTRPPTLLVEKNDTAFLTSFAFKF